MLIAPNAVPRVVSNTQSAFYSIFLVDSPANYNLPHQLSNPAQVILCQTHQSNLFYCDYQKTDKKGVYQVDRDQVKDQPKDFYPTFVNRDKNISYSKEGFEEIAVNFIGIDALCNKCHITFPFKIKTSLPLEECLPKNGFY